MIKIYTKNKCVACKMTKNWLQNNNLKYVEHNVDEDVESFNYLIKNDFRTLPVVFENMATNEPLAMGFQPQNLKKLSREED